MPDKPKNEQPEAEQPDWVEALYAEGADEAPPAALDATIREAARSHAVTPWYREPRRLTGLAAAASFVIVVLIGVYDPNPESSAPETGTLDTAETTRDGSASFSFEDEAQTLAEPQLLEEAVSAPRQEVARKRETPQPTPAARSDLAAPATATDPRDNAEAAKAVAPATAAASSQPDRETALAAEATLSEVAASEIAARESVSSEPRVDAAVTADARGAAELENLALAGPDAASLEARLIEACGPLPGTAASRRWEEDSAGLYLVIDGAEGARYFRCGRNPASAAAEAGWYEIAAPEPAPSEQ